MDLLRIFDVGPLLPPELAPTLCRIIDDLVEASRPSELDPLRRSIRVQRAGMDLCGELLGVATLNADWTMSSAHIQRLRPALLLMNQRLNEACPLADDSPARKNF